MSDKRYQVFISSTYQDLAEGRSALYRALLPLGFMPCGMSMHGAGDQTWSTIKKLIDECDYFILLSGGRYGSLTPTGVGFTHMEYVYASAKQKPILILLNDAPDALPVEQQEKTADGKFRLEGFRQLLQKSGHQLARWRNEADLDRAITEAIPQLLATKPVIGWVRAEGALNVDDKAIQALKMRIAELEQDCDQLVNKTITSTALLASGREQFAVKFSCKAYAHGNCEAVTTALPLSWNDIFLRVAPYMGQPQTESFLSDKLSEGITEKALVSVQKLRPNVHAVADVEVDAGAFNSIKMQFRTVGLIRRAVEFGDEKMLWRLTGSGDLLLATLSTLKKIEV